MVSPAVWHMVLFYVALVFFLHVLLIRMLIICRPRDDSLAYISDPVFCRILASLPLTSVHGLCPLQKSFCLFSPPCLSGCLWILHPGVSSYLLIRFPRGHGTGHRCALYGISFDSLVPPFSPSWLLDGLPCEPSLPSLCMYMYNSGNPYP